MSRPMRIAAVLALAGSAVVAGTSAAHADVALTVTPSSGLADAQIVDAAVSGLIPSTLAQVELSECANAYADGSALPSIVPATDCTVLTYAPVPTASIDLEVAVKETGIGAGNRACFTLPASCYLWISRAINENGAVGLQVPISFAQDPASSSPTPTSTTATVTGAPLGVGKTAYVRVAVSTDDPAFFPEGTASVDLDGAPAGTATVAPGPQGTGTSFAEIPVGAPSLGTHSVDAHFVGNGSYASSDSASQSLPIIAATNVTIGDASVVEGDAAGTFRTVSLPVMLSTLPSTNVTVPYTTVPNDAIPGTDYQTTSGTLTFIAGRQMVKYVVIKVFPNTIADGDRTFSVQLGAPNMASGYVLRRATGIATIIDDDTNPAGGPTVSVGDYSVPEGDSGPNHVAKVALTLSQSVNVPVSVTVQVTSGTATHGTRKGGADWGGKIVRTVSFKAGRVAMSVNVATFPDLAHEPDETIFIEVLSVNGLGPTGLGGRENGTVTILSDE